MSRVVTVRHPVPVTFVPKGGRKPRLAMAACETPVELREAEPEEFSWFGYLDREEYRSRGNGLWLPVHGWHHWSDRSRLEDGEFEAFLAGTTPPDKVTASMHHLFLRTPVAAAATAEARGTAFDHGAAREMVEDGTERARAALRAFFESDVRWVPGRGVVSGAMVRVPPPMAGLKGERTFSVLGSRLEMLTRPRSPNPVPLVCRLDRAQELWDSIRKALRGDDGGRHREVHVTGDDGRGGGGVRLGLVPDPMRDDEDLAIMANDMPRIVLSHLLPALSRFPARDTAANVVALREDAARLARQAGWGMIGLAEDHEEIFRTARQAMDLALSKGIVQEPDALRCFMLVSGYVRDIALPRLSEHPPVAEADEEALLGL